MPRFEIEQVEDAYVLYVTSIGVPNEVFWDMPISVVKTIAENKSAYDGWMISEKEKMYNNAKGR